MSSFYRDETLADRLRAAQEDATAPEVLYIDEDLSTGDLAALYRSCNCSVHPYRAEGFCLPLLEAMACGLPVIATGGGPSDEYIEEATGIRLPSLRSRPTTVTLTMSSGSTFDCAGDPWESLPDTAALRDALRWVATHPEDAQKMGARASHHVRANWTWAHTVKAMRTRLRCLTRRSPDGAAPQAIAMRQGV